MKKTALKILTAIAITFAFTTNAQAWTDEDTMWETAYLAAHITDWGQTRDISAHCSTTGKYYETNPILGDCPSQQMVNTYFLGTALAHITVARMLPKKYRRMFQAGTLGMQINFINNNKEIGLKINF